MVEGEPGAMGGCAWVGRVQDGVQMAGGHAGLEDQVFMRFGEAVPVVEDGEGPVAAVREDRCHKDASGPGVAGVAQELEEGVLDVGDARRAAAGALEARETGEAGAEVPVWTFHYEIR